jgi:hypothetical protein
MEGDEEEAFGAVRVGGLDGVNGGVEDDVNDDDDDDDDDDEEEDDDDDEVDDDDDGEDEEDEEDDDEEEEGRALPQAPDATRALGAPRDDLAGGSGSGGGSGGGGEKRARPAEFAAGGASRWVKKWVLSGHMRVYRWVPADQASDAPRPARTTIEEFLARMASDTAVSVVPRRRSTRTNQ